MGSYSLLVTEDTVNLSHNRPWFGTGCILTFDIYIAFYTVTPFSFFFFILYTTGTSAGEGT